MTIFSFYNPIMIYPFWAKCSYFRHEFETFKISKNDQVKISENCFGPRSQKFPKSNLV